MSRKGEWMQTVSGRAFYPMDARPEDIFIEDIAHALSMQCRFGGHCNGFYSVAQHSVYVSRVCESQDALWGLLHDASEAYIQDVIRPIKRMIPEYSSIEKRVMDCVVERFGLASKMPASVEYADKVMLATEARDLMKPHPMEWEPLPEPVAWTIAGWGPAFARESFLETFHLLGGKQ